MEWDSIKEGRTYAYAFRVNSGLGRVVEKVTKMSGQRFCVIEDKDRNKTVEARPSQVSVPA